MVLWSKRGQTSTEVNALTRTLDDLAARLPRRFWLASGLASVAVLVSLVATRPSSVFGGRLSLHKLVTLVAATYTLLSALVATSGEESRSEDDEPRFDDEISEAAVWSVLDSTDVENPLTAAEIASILEREDTQAVLGVLRNLAATGEAESTLTDGNDVRWWRPSSEREEIAEAQRSRVRDLVFWTADGTVRPRGEWRDFGHEEAVLLYLVGKHYASDDGAAENPWATWGELTEEIDVDQRIKRSVAEALGTDSVTRLLQEQYDGTNKQFRILVERLPAILDRVERSTAESSGTDSADAGE
jgi:hypothetical protein